MFKVIFAQRLKSPNMTDMICRLVVVLSVQCVLIDFHVLCCCLAQEDILDLQLQRNLEYLDQKVRKHWRMHTTVPK